jgi:hypothetical protein
MTSVRYIQLNLNLQNLKHLIKEVKVKLNEAESKTTILKESLKNQQELDKKFSKE